ncbi:hypothetical protein F5Y09DRAFT_239516 [Xylaria sp. FL1042]|nr:hypothetical protein F5Y09DRAFT_239516 [Xylaria sp. FL1042]
MPFSYPPMGVRATGSTNVEMKPPSNPGMSLPSGPSPSLWPEPARSASTSASASASSAASRVHFNPASESRNTAINAPGGDASYTNNCESPHTTKSSQGSQGSAQTGYAVSSDYSHTSQAASGSNTLPTSVSTTSLATRSPPARPIDITASSIFQPHYPRWHCYPPALPTTFDKNRCPSPLKGSSFDPTDKFLQQSGAFQGWVGKKNAERIQLRHTPTYESLVAKLHKQQHIADWDQTPAGRTDAILQAIEIKKRMAKERTKFARAELEYIREIEKGFMVFGSIDNYEQTIARLRHLSTVSQVEPETPLSKVERLLGSDGSCISISSWTQRCQSVAHKVICEEAGVEPVDQSDGESKKPVSDSNDKPLVACQGIMPWPDKPYEILIPDWFPVAAAQGNLEMNGRTAEEKYINLIHYIGLLELDKEQEAYKEKHPDDKGATMKDFKWDKNWHGENPGWRYEKHRRMGGWWKCPKGPEALPAEKNCKVCLDDKVTEPELVPVTQLFDDVMRHIGEAMAVVAEKDKKMVLEFHANKKPIGLGVPGPLVGEGVKMWAHQENPLATAEPDTIPLGARQPWINYNPLRGQDDPVEAIVAAEPYLQQTAAGNKEQKQPDDEGAGKGKGKHLSEADPTNEGIIS